MKRIWMFQRAADGAFYSVFGSPGFGEPADFVVAGFPTLGDASGWLITYLREMAEVEARARTEMLLSAGAHGRAS